MIHKVSGSNTKMDLFTDMTSHESMNKSAMSSFENVLLATANKLMSEGRSLDEVANSFGMSSAELTKIVEDNIATKTASSPQPVEKTASVASINEAELAYNALHGISRREDKFAASKTGKSVHSAMGNQSVTDVGGPSKQIGVRNTIWDSEVLAKMANTKDGGEVIRESHAAEQARRAEIKQSTREQTIDPEVVKMAMQRDSTVQSFAANDGYKFSNKLPTRGISIFDAGEFDRIPDKTAGEKAVEEKKTAGAPKEREFTAAIQKTQSNSKDIFKAMIDSMLDNKE